MEFEDLKAAVREIIRPDAPADAVDAEVRISPARRLKDNYGLDLSFWRPFEFGSFSKHSRLVRSRDDPINKTTESLSAPEHLLWSAINLLGESIIAYAAPDRSWLPGEKWGPYLYYPPILITFWAGFEAYVRLYSEILVHTVPKIPQAVRLTLLEFEEHVDPKNGVIRERPRRRPVLDRYWLLLRYGYNFEFDRGGKFWQAGEAASAKRDQLVHYDLNDCPTIKTSELWTHLECILLMLIYPSSQIQRTVYSAQYGLHRALCRMLPLIEDFEERPIQKGWHGDAMFSPYSFPCTFTGIDESRYPAERDVLSQDAEDGADE